MSQEAGISPIRTLLIRTIVAMEAVHGRGSSPWNIHRDGDGNPLDASATWQEELLPFLDPPDRTRFEAMALRVWHLCFDRRRPTVWFLRNSSPESAVLLLLGTMAQVPVKHLLDAELSERSILHLTSVASRLADSPIQIVSAPSTAAMVQRAAFARKALTLEAAVLDWIPSPAEIAALNGLQLFIHGVDPAAQG